MVECCKLVGFYFDVCDRDNVGNVGTTVLGVIDWGKGGPIIDEYICKRIVGGSVRV